MYLVQYDNCWLGVHDLSRFQCRCKVRKSKLNYWITFNFNCLAMGVGLVATYSN
jgi:hypothetical protein